MCLSSVKREGKGFVLIRAIIIRSLFDEQCSLSIISFNCDHHLLKIDEKRKMKQKKVDERAWEGVREDKVLRLPTH